MIEVRGLTKRYGAKIAVDDLTFGIEPGKVTGFLGPNGAGKTTTMRCILGLDYADEGTVTVPLVGRSSPRMSRMVVVLPAPFGPRKPVILPGSTLNDRSSTATLSP